MIDPAANRRPIKSRQMPVFQRLASRLAKTSITPNQISGTSILFALVAGIAMAATSSFEAAIAERGLWILAAAMIQCRLIANLLDGMVAVEGGKSSPVGDLYNEVPDRVSDSAIFIGAGYAVGGYPLLGFAAALVAVFVAYVRAIGASVDAGQVFAGPFAKPQRMALMTTICVAMAILPSAWQAVPSQPQITVVGIALAVICIGGIITAIRRLQKIAAILRLRK
ncbi:CDP-diacylglycerol--glycerol-3-phosphate 3-phosphatidyltransferase-related protein [Rhodopirellula maiorica SM1]|uniref:CDP-diacylglycerol--glycerol-3-phosphate 3-phosphatidyltransferase-related protein n=1 Tax=Rhodopirellula maiorica SM1 TaxID=1265738 RepID=M5RVH3_9BACT|nr:CDP-alcohol phosphatidyltransferase family protein [Rhodopirellula maiorica]EMI19392.1 CDP-diacylglycerol--glycerol-3-phosphate 3-phosphatidyltransferase-related protein [Rhodopirellula maiorica SM1]